MTDPGTGTHRCRILIEWWQDYPDTGHAERHVADVAAFLTPDLPGCAFQTYAEPNPPDDERVTTPDGAPDPFDPADVVALDITVRIGAGFDVHAPATRHTFTGTRAGAIRSLLELAADLTGKKVTPCHGS